MKKLILATTASLALAFSVSAQTATYTAEQLNRAATKSPEQKAAAVKFTEQPAGKAIVTTTATTTATTTPVSAKPVVAAKAEPVAAAPAKTAEVHYGPAPKTKTSTKTGTSSGVAPNGRASLNVSSTKKAPITGASKANAAK